MRFTALALGCSALVFYAHGAALAAEGTVSQSSDTERSSTTAIDEIVVTARKRAESIQDVPIAVTALDATAIERSNIIRIDQVAALAPNVQLQPITVNPTGMAAYIRGIGNRAQEPSQDVPIAISIDGVYVADIAGSLIDVFDVEQIEVLRGPQGTLQGRNSPGGAITVRTKRPTGKLGSSFQASYGRFDELQLKAAFEAPISDVLSFRASGFRNSGGDYFDNIFTGSEAGGIKNSGGRIGLLFQPTSEFTAFFTADFIQDKSPQAAIRPVNLPTAEGPRQPISTACAAYGYCEPLGKHEVASNLDDPNHSNNGGLALNMDWDLGPVTLTSVTGHRFVNETTQVDVDALPATIIHARDRDVDTRLVSQELRIASNGDGPWNYIVGAFVSESKFNLTAPLLIGSRGLGIAGPDFDISATSHRSQTTDSYAVFSEVGYAFTDQWSVSVGARQTWDRKDMKSEPSVPGPTGKFKNDDDNLSAEAGVEYRLDQDTLLYAKFSQGYRSGGINGDAPSLDAINNYDPETLDSYEIGLKKEWLDRMLTTNLSAFHYKFTDIQILAVDSAPSGVVQRVVNGDNLKVDGVELELALRPTSQLAVTGSVGYLDARYGSQIANIGFGATNLKDVRKEYAPKWSGYLGVSYTMPLSAESAGSVVFNADSSWRSGMATNPADNPVGYQDAYSLVNAAVTYRTADERYGITLYGRNLTDKYYKTGGEASGGFALYDAVGRPRSYGVRLSANF